jgi:hypothetical protein
VLGAEEMPKLLDYIAQVKDGGVVAIRVGAATKMPKPQKKPVLYFSVRSKNYGDSLHCVPAKKLDQLLHLVQTLHESEKEIVEFDIGRLRNWPTPH